MKITKSYIEQWVNNKMKDLEFPYKVVEVLVLKWRSDQIEAGPYMLSVRLQGKKHNDVMMIYSFHRLADLQQHVNQGKTMYLSFPKFRITSSNDILIEVQ